MKKNLKHIIAFMMAMLCVQVFGQLSPGDLSEAHAHLEGLSNCTQCHILGKKVGNDKCLACHSALKSRVDQKRGYHSSKEVDGKECIECHSDHHGRKFEMIRFSTQGFDHLLTGYELIGAHNNKDCAECHKKKFIAEQELKDKEFTYLGLDQNCLSCHDDYHQQTLSPSCINCHTYEKFKPAANFDHNKTKFQLLGKHQEVDCAKCHRIETRNNAKFQVFAGIGSKNCTSCHEDVHKNKFGPACTNCHTEQSFHIIKGMNSFDHNKTSFMLEGQHRFIKCSACHKTKYTDPIKHQRCADCHNDYHEKQFARQGQIPDCINCHNNQRFAGSTFTVEEHNKSKFLLQGAHLATPCFACHKKEEKWNFRNIGEKCNDCHTDIHQKYISSKFYPDANCESCHSVEKWNSIENFNHSLTKFELTGGHLKPYCADCHFKIENNTKVQQFIGLSNECNNCHEDVHFKQFEVNGTINCSNCHETLNWQASKFDHISAAFKLDGKHKDVACDKCHKPVISNQISYIQYKFKDFRCETCH